MEELLFLSHRIPYPPNKGDKIRSFHWLQSLAARYRVHLGTFADDPADRVHRPVLEDLCDRVCIRELKPKQARFRSAQGLWRGEPLSFAYYRDRELKAWVTSVLRERPIAAVVVFSSAMAPYVAGFSEIRRILDLVDVDSEKWRQYAHDHRGLMRWVYKREARTLLEAERALVSNFDASVLVSRAEKELFDERAPECASRTIAIGNGVDTAYFDPAVSLADPYDGAGTPQLVFTGAMDYAPNIEAVRWFVTEVWPLVQARAPQAKFCIVGSRPTREVRDLADVDGVSVTGAVDDVRPYLQYATLAVAPMLIARGLQNKVLEALAMGRPVVLTPAAAAGLEPLDTAYAGVDETASGFAEQVLRLLETASPHGYVQVAREYTLAHYGWPRQLDRLGALVEGDESQRSLAGVRDPDALQETACASQT